MIRTPSSQDNNTILIDQLEPKRFMKAFGKSDRITLNMPGNVPNPFIPFDAKRLLARLIHEGLSFDAGERGMER